MATLYGTSISPFVRKVAVFAAEIGVVLERQAQPPSQDPEYLALHPLGKIPALRDGDLVLPDSSVIVAYLDKKAGGTGLYPDQAADFGRALWYEEYADTRCFDVLVRGVFFERVVMPKLYGKPGNEALVKQNVVEELPKVLDYLEGEIGDLEYLVGNTLTIADIALASPFVNLQYGQEAVDGGRWPNVHRWLKGILARPSFQHAMEEDRQMMTG